ncbi:hypothetical protein [Nocardia sp. NPDC057440]|uniref:hypothetical protein n=1 Tax=Nocardia sp. NPDC057440 TaxID=3346134 RepID=UPI00366F9917
MPYVKNWPLLVSAIEQIINHPETWNQGTWGKKNECGTAYCVAGWVLKLSENVIDKFVWDDYYFGSELDLVIINGAKMEPENAASKLLGLGSWADEWSLYSPGNSLQRVLNVVVDWANRDGYELPALITDAHAVLLAKESV